MHGKKKTIYTVGKSKIFEGLGDSFQAARYHSLAAVRDELAGGTLRVTAEAEDGEIMAVEHTEYPVYGVQFHPESVHDTGWESDDSELYKYCKEVR